MKRHYSKTLFGVSGRFLFLWITLVSVATVIECNYKATTLESEEQAYRYTDRIRAYVNITYIDPLTGLKKSEKSLTGKWGTNGRMEQVTGSAMVGKYSGNQTDGCQKLDQPNPSPSLPWIAVIKRGNCRFKEKIRNAMNANASAVIIFNNEPNQMPLFMYHDVENAVAIFITKEFGDHIVTLLENEVEVILRIDIGLEKSPYPTMGQMDMDIPLRGGCINHLGLAIPCWPFSARKRFTYEEMIRLSGNGSTSAQGRVEVLHNGTWGTVCIEWGPGNGRMASVVCRMLGFPIGNVVGYNYGPGTGQIWLKNVRCAGNESSIFDCPHDAWESERGCKYGHLNVLAVECFKDDEPLPRELQLWAVGEAMLLGVFGLAVLGLLGGLIYWKKLRNRRSLDNVELLNNQ